MSTLQLEKPLLTPDYVWDAYATNAQADTEAPEVPAKPKDQLTVLVSLIRRACGIDSELKAYDKTIENNFKTWIFKQNAGQHNRFTKEQLDWLRMIKDHVVSSYHIEIDDLDYTPFDAKGGKGKMHQLFGNQIVYQILVGLNNEMQTRKALVFEQKNHKIDVKRQKSDEKYHLLNKYGAK